MSDDWPTPYKEFLVMNDTNVRVDLRGSNPWPYEPMPCNLTPDQCIVLHLWAPVLRCRLIQDKPVPELAETHHYYTIAAADVRLDEDLGKIPLETAVASSLREGVVHEVIAIDGPWRNSDSSDISWLASLILVSRYVGTEFVEESGCCPSQLLGTILPACFRVSSYQDDLRCMG